MSAPLVSPSHRLQLCTRRQGLMAAALASLFLTGCGAFTQTQRAQNYESREWLQSGTNRLANLALRDNLQSVQRVQLSLYRRNPREWRKWAATAEEATQRTWDAVMNERPLAELRGATSIDAVRLAFEPGYEGDRVAALVVGWGAMLKQANGDTWQQTMIDGVSAENAHRAARNFEISLWLLSARMGADGKPLLLSTEISERGRNLVVDRELSKVVGRLDLLAAQADEKYRRAALDFSQNWLMGSLGPFLSMVQR
ncbi:MAG: hypothetical protein EOO29_24650 [Comamonadaceae bacterium]|nr:MAG: hypothetical protein EOO29_24650 [Comamonadaceae bacterium]